MEPPPAPPLSAAITGPQLSYPDSVDSSPRSRNTDSWDEPLPPVPGGAKLRLMCSYGGHIVPRPHDKSLCYVSGDTRMVVVDRNTCLSDLSARLSKTLLNNRPFTLKYQLPNEDLDSLISVTTDEDLDNMIDEYDRICSGSGSGSGGSMSKSSRLRLFLFPLKPETASSIGSILDNSTKSEDWFLNALNGAGVLSRGFPDSASVNCLLGLDSDVAGAGNEGSRELEGGSCKNLKQDVHSVPDSPMLETTSSFGSASSAPLLANLPPIRVHVEDGGGGVQKVGIEEQFAQMSIAAAQKHDEGFVVLSSPPPIPTSIVAPIGVSAVPISSAGEYLNRVFSDDERSEQGLPVGYRKPPQPQPQPQTQPQTLPPQSQQKPTVGIDLHSPDSVSSDSSLTNAMSRAKPVIYQDPAVQISTGTSRVPANPVDPKINISDPNTWVQMQQQVQESGYILQPQVDQQQQFIHAGTHYIHHHPSGPVPISNYYPVYPSQQQQQHQHQQLQQLQQQQQQHQQQQLQQLQQHQLQQQQQHLNQLEQQYQMFYMPTRQAQAYNLSVQQPNFSEASTAIPSSRPQTPPNPSLIPTPAAAAYNPTRNAAPPPKPEMTAGMYRTATAAAPPLVQVSPPNQHQQQPFVGYSQIHPSQSIAPTSAATANYAYEFADPSQAHPQLYYTQPLAPTLPQYQTMTSAPAVRLPEASAQLPSENMKQQIRTSQAL